MHRPATNQGEQYSMSNLYPVVSSGIELADVDIMDGLFDLLEAMDGTKCQHDPSPRGM